MSQAVQMIKNLPAMQETWDQSLGQGRSPGEGNGNPLQYSFLENLMDRGAWRATVHGVTKKELDTTEQLTLSLYSLPKKKKKSFGILLEIKHEKVYLIQHHMNNIYLCEFMGVCVRERETEREKSRSTYLTTEILMIFNNITPSPQKAS